jgi:hypothetical protein
MTFHDKNLYLADYSTTRTILKEKKYFEYLTLIKTNVTIISGPTNMIKGSGRANILLPNNTKLGIRDALYSLGSRRNLLNFNDTCANGYYIEIIDEDRKEYLYIISCISGQELILEKLHAFFSEIYDMIMKFIETNVAVHQKCSNPKIFMLWYYRLGHPG